MTVVAARAAATRGMSRTRRWAILAAMLLGTTLAVVDSSILNISVTPIMEEFRTDLGTAEWILTSYNLAFAVFMIGLGSLGDTIGRRRLYVAGELTFVAGSALAVAATGPWQLVLFRAVQGLGAAALAPNALALILDHFPEGERGSALGIWGAAAALGGALGPTVGGMVAEAWGWRALFLMNVPIGLGVAGASYALLTPDARQRSQPFDAYGFVSLSAALLAVSLALMAGPALPGGWGRGALMALALALGAWFVRVERRAPAPLVDPRAILRPGVMAANLAVFFALFVMAGGMFLSVLYAQLLADASPARIGVLLAPCAAATFVVAPIGGHLADGAGPRALAVAGLLGLGASVAIPAWWHPASPASLVLWSKMIAGAGLGLATPALIRASTEGVPRRRAGLGAGVYKTVNELGGVFGVVLLGTFLEGRIVANALRGLPRHFLPDELSLKTVSSLKALESHAVQKGLAAGDLEGFHRALTEAVRRGFDQVFGLAVLLAAIGVLAGVVLPRRLGAPSGERHERDRA